MNWTGYWKSNNPFERIVRWYKMRWGYRRFLDFIPRGKVLEVGCGKAYLSRLLRLSEPWRMVISTDIDPAVHPDFVMDTLKLDYPNNSFEVVMSCGLMEHFTDLEFLQATEEQLRVANKVIIMMPAPSKFWNIVWALRGVRLKHYLRTKPRLEYLLGNLNCHITYNKVCFGLLFPYWVIKCVKRS